MFERGDLGGFLRLLIHVIFSSDIVAAVCMIFHTEYLKLKMLLFFTE